MDYIEVEKIHEKYNAYMDGYNLVGSYSAYVPFFKVKMKIIFLYEVKLNIIEEYICRCVSEGITDSEDIKFVLALEDDIFDFVILSLINNNYIVETVDYYKNNIQSKSYDLTELGLSLFSKKIKHEPKVSSVDFYYDGLNPEYKIEFFDNDVDHKFLRHRDLKDKESKFVILPETFPAYSREKDLPNLSKKILKNIKTINTEYGYDIYEENIIDIVDFEMTDKKDLFYHEYRILVYKNKNKQYKLLAYDPCGLKFFDQRVTDTILELYHKGKFNYLIEKLDDNDSRVDNIIASLENYAVKDYYEFDSKESEKVEKTIYQLKNREIVTKYIMNYDIRKLFLKYLKEAKHSLYIISPWMNNYIINDDFINSILNLLRRGVKIRIICGITDGNEKNMNRRDKMTLSIAEKLSKIASPYGDLFKISSGQTHEKLLICDEKYYINGSFNFLSYAGENDEFFRNEGSTYSEDKELIAQTIKLRFNF